MEEKKEGWRFISYMFVHSGYFHITFNIVVQVGVKDINDNEAVPHDTVPLATVS